MNNKEKAEAIFDELHIPNLSYTENIENQIKCCRMLLKEISVSNCYIRTKHWNDIIIELENLNND